MNAFLPIFQKSLQKSVGRGLPHQSCLFDQYRFNSCHQLLTAAPLERSSLVAKTLPPHVGIGRVTRSTKKKPRASITDKKRRPQVPLPLGSPVISWVGCGPIWICETKILTQMPLPSGSAEGSSMGVLDVDPSGRAIFWVSSLTTAPAIYLIGVSSPSPYEILRLTPVIELPGLDLKIFSDIKAKISNPKANSFSALYVGPRCLHNEKECKVGTIPLIVFPHGGPHVSFGNAFNMDAAFFAQLGFGVLLVNYRGSTGTGAASVESLPGHIGYQDVGDVHQAAIEALECLPKLDQTRCLLYGGSHGGFLVLHLSGQYPNRFKAVVSLNPVTNMSAFMVSDIPDWAIVESGFEYTSWEASKAMYDKMLLVSPLQHANAVKAPTLFLLGKKDLRVPPSQGLTFYHALKQRNVETKVLMYDDNHPISQVPHEMDAKINAVLWFIEHADVKLHIIEHK